MPNFPIADQNIIKVLGLEALPDERKIALIEKISEVVQKRLLLRILEALPRQSQLTFKGILDRDSESETAEFLKKNVPELAEWTLQEVSKVKEELAERVSKSDLA